MRRQGRWRKSGKRGVSPIIATILLVAITVVLAAVLYVLISGLTRGPGNTPIGSAFAVSSATDGVCSVGFCYTFTIQTASSGVSANSLKFQVQSSGGVITAFTNVRLIDVSNCAVGAYTTLWTAGAPATPTGGPASCAGGTPGLTSQVSSGDQLILASTTSFNAAGYVFVVIGTGSYSGTIQAAIP
ncbi:MAG: type IV pilin [Thermoplasmata archaeon]|nr:type IV pilin [Thermoplasmata archaeon]